jgi:hypothetical protein
MQSMKKTDKSELDHSSLNINNNFIFIQTINGHYHKILRNKKMVSDQLTVATPEGILAGTHIIS